MLPQRLPETSKISAENEKTVALATVFSLFFVIEHIAVQRVFLYAGFGGNCLDRVLLGLALLHAAADCLEKQNGCEVECHFCRKHYRFSGEELEALLAQAHKENDGDE